MIEKRKILEWLIDDIDLSKRRELFNIKHQKEITDEQEIMEIFELELIDYRGRKLIQRKDTIIYFYPLTIEDYLNQ